MLTPHMNLICSESQGKPRRCVEWGSTNTTGTSMFKISRIKCEVKHNEMGMGLLWLKWMDVIGLNGWGMYDLNRWGNYGSNG